MRMFSNDMRVANTASPSFQSQANVGQYGWTGADQGHYNQLIQYVDECRNIAIYLEEKIAYVEGILSEVEGIDAQVQHVNNVAEYVEKLHDETKVYRDQMAALYLEVKPLYDDFIIKYTDFSLKYPEVVTKHGEVLISAASASASEVSAKASADKAQELVDELQKGQVYRGTWNPHTAAYPDNKGTNSVWDVILNEGELEYRWNGVLWFWGDRLLYIKDSDEYQQLESGGSVVSVNGKKGAVTLDAKDVKAAPDGFGLGGSGFVMSSTSCDDALNSGFYAINSATTGTPYGTGPSGSTMTVTKWGSGTGVSQTFYTYNSDRVHVRRRENNAWKPWFELYSTSNKPTVNDVTGALQRIDYGIGAKQGDNNDAINYTEDGTRDFNKLLTSGIYSVSGSWLNSVNNTGVAQANTSIVEVIARSWESGPAYFQRIYMRTAEMSSRYAERTGNGTYPNITWSKWRENGTYQTNLQYRMTIERAGDAYPYITTSRNDYKEGLAATATYPVGNIQFKVGPKTDDNNPDSAKRAALIQGNLFGDQKSGELYLASYNHETDSANCIARLRHDGFWATHGSKTMKYTSGELTLDNNKVFHEGYLPTIEAIAPGKTIGSSTALGVVNLDDYTTSGVWHQGSNANATSGQNYPTSMAGSLVVYTAAGVIQEYRVYNSSRCFRRAKYGVEPWRPWTEEYNTANKPTAFDIVGTKDYISTYNMSAITIAAGKREIFVPRSTTSQQGIRITNGVFSITKTGTYRINWGFSIEPVGPAQQGVGSVWVNDVEVVPACIYNYCPTSTDALQMGTSSHCSILKLNAGDEVTCRVAAVNNTTVKIFQSGFITIDQL